jgi:hypothetical protein
MTDRSDSLKSSDDNGLFEKGYWSTNGKYYGLTAPAPVDLSTLKRYSVPIDGSFCPYCKLEYRRPNSVKQHIDSVHSKLKPFNCDYCQLWCCSQFVLRDHNSQVHGIVRPLKRDDCSYEAKAKIQRAAKHKGQFGMFGCSRCAISFQTPKDLRFHNCQTCSPKRFVCSLCEVSFADTYSVENHYRTSQHIENLTQRQKSGLDECIQWCSRCNTLLDAPEIELSSHICLSPNKGMDIDIVD